MQTASSMHGAARLTPGTALLAQHANLSFTYGTDHYSFQTGAAGQGTTYAVSDGSQKLTYQLLWAFGTGRVGQSYLFKKEDGNFYEARVTFFERLGELGFTPARALNGPTDLATAMGRQMSTSELIRCFSCHATAVNIAGHFNEAGLVAGVTCEACHGPGAQHVAEMKAGARTVNGGGAGAMLNPAHLSPTESVEFCGSCHGSWWDVKLAHVTGPSTVRSAPYRLVTSKCWGTEGDRRLVCTACHDPHRELVTDISSYDVACLRCHAGGAGQHAATVTKVVAGGAPTAPACPVAKQRCASCHMPQVYVPEMQDSFTDHRIRIVRKDEPFRD